jgi:excisionase family DNA binding protein
MSTTSVARNINFLNSDIKDRNGYMTTTELSKLCGVSRFTIINWIKQGKIKVIKTVGNHYRIPESEAISLLDDIDENKKPSKNVSLGQDDKKKTKKRTKLKRGIRLRSRTKNNKLSNNKKNNVLYAFGYGVGRSVHALKGRCKVK